MRPFALLITLSFLLLACGKGTTTSSVRPVTDDSEWMRDTLRQIALSAQPGMYWHEHLQLATYYGQLAQQQRGREKMRSSYFFYKEMLNAGRNEETVRGLETLARESEFSVDFINDFSRPFYELLALAYLRIGELENCIANHSAESCILPIQGGGVHQLTSGSERAIQLYEKLLAADPSDLNSRWLLNIAYMTLGRYPEGVPAPYRIPGLAPAQDCPLDPLTNVSMGLGIDVNAISGGVAVEDFDGDGLLDIVCSSYGLRDQLRFFRNNGDGTFEDRTEAANLVGIISGLNLTHADYDNDGDNDLLVLRGGWLRQSGGHPNSLLRNRGDGTFEDVTRPAGLLSLHPTQTGDWADFDRDGDLDLFIGNESTEGDLHPCELFVNQGDGTFVERAADFGLDAKGGIKGVDWGDYDNDGYPDLFLSNMTGRNFLFHNEGPTETGWSFTNQTVDAGVAEPLQSFPTWFFDYDNDGRLDLFVAGYDPREMEAVAAAEAAYLLDTGPRRSLPKLFRNAGEGVFEDRTRAANLERPMFAMGSNFGDLDNDGNLDMYIGTGAPDLRSLVPNLLFRNTGEGAFLDLTYRCGMGHVQKGHAVGFGDIDNDGDEDVYAVLGGAVEGDNFQNALFRNDNEDANWISLHLTGTAANRSAIGARIELELLLPDGTSRTLYRWVGTGGSFGGNSLRQEIGLGNATQLQRLTVTWPDADRSTQEFTGLETRRHYALTQGESPVVRQLPTFELMAGDHAHHNM
jgi:tetratricopeptide (TPR) repeat protein